VKDLAAPPVSPVVWEAALGRRVVLIEDRLWVNAREKARAMLGGEPVYVETSADLDATLASPRNLPLGWVRVQPTRGRLFVWDWAR